MPTHASTMESTRHTKKTLYVVATFYVVVGFLAATVSALNGDRLGAFLGFLIISGALAATALLLTVLRIGVRISAVGEAVVEMHAQLDRLETGLNELGEKAALNGGSPASTGGERLHDSAAIGNANPGVLTATTLDHEAFPRLVATLEEEPPEYGEDVLVGDEEQFASDWTIQAESCGAFLEMDQADAATKNLLRQWHVALHDGDLAECREVYSALGVAVGTDAVASLGEQIEELADRVERSLREAFSSCVRGGDIAEALAIGERIFKLLPDRAVATEFQRIRPYLLDRLNREGSTIDPRLTVSQ